MDAVTTLVPTVGVVPACQALGIARASFYRQTRPLVPVPQTSAVPSPQRVSARALDLAERQAILDVLRSPRFQDCSPTEVYATRPNEVWSWDITKLLGPTKWTYFSLSVILDIFSRYVVGLLTPEAADPERFVNHAPIPPPVPTAVWRRFQVASRRQMHAKPLFRQFLNCFSRLH